MNSSARGPRLAIVPTGGVAQVGGGYASYTTYGEFLDELAALVGGLTLYAPVYDRGHPEHEYFSQRTLDPDRIDVVPLPSHARTGNGLELLANYARHALVLAAAAGGWNEALIYSPSVTAGLASLALRRAPRCRVFSYIWGDWAELSRHLPQPGRVRQIADPIQRRFILHEEENLVRRSVVTWVAGRQLRLRYEPLGRVEETMPMIKAGDLFDVAIGEATRAPNRLLYIGRVAPGKGLELLLNALASISECPGLHLTVVGGGDSEYIATVKGLATDLEIANRVEFLGTVPNGDPLWAEHARATMLVLPSLSEGFPRVLYEAMALGTPILTTDVGSITTVLNHGESAHVVRPGDVDALRDGLRVMLAQPTYRDQLARNARVEFERRFPKGSSTTAQRVATAVLAARAARG